MLNFSIKTHKNPLHQRFQMSKFFTNCYSELVKKKKNHFIFPNGSFFYFSFLSLFHFSPLFRGSSSLLVADLCSSSLISASSSSICPRPRRSLSLRRQSVSDLPSNLRGGGSWTVLSPFFGFRWFRLKVIAVRRSQCFCGSF